MFMKLRKKITRSSLRKIRLVLDYMLYIYICIYFLFRVVKSRYIYIRVVRGGKGRQRGILNFFFRIKKKILKN